MSACECARQSCCTAQSVALTCDHSTAFLTRRRFFSHTRIALDMDAACIREQGQAGETSQEHCPGPTERTALSRHNTFLRNHAAAETQGECRREQRDCSLSASRNSCLRLNLNINVKTRALCFASKYGARARCEGINEV